MENLIRLNTFDTRPRTWPESNESRKKQGKVKKENAGRKKTPDSGQIFSSQSAFATAYLAAKASGREEPPDPARAAPLRYSSAS